MGIPLGRRTTDAIEQVRATAKDAGAFAWAVLGVACAALLLGAVALLRSYRAAAA